MNIDTRIEWNIQTFSNDKTWSKINPIEKKEEFTWYWFCFHFEIDYKATTIL